MDTAVITAAVKYAVRAFMFRPRPRRIIFQGARVRIEYERRISRQNVSRRVVRIDIIYVSEYRALGSGIRSCGILYVRIIGQPSVDKAYLEAERDSVRQSNRIRLNGIVVSVIFYIEYLRSRLRGVLIDQVLRKGVYHAAAVKR